jgi:pentatricopeptide repeat protein
MRNGGPSLRPNVFAFTAAIGAVGRGGQWQRALALLDEMTTQGLDPDTPAYNAVIHACILSGRVDEALQVCACACACVQGDSNLLLNCLSNERSPRYLNVPCNLIADQVLERMEAAGHNLDIATVTDLHAALSKCGRVEEAGRLYKEAVQSGVLPSSDLDGEWEVDVSLLPPQLARAKVFATLERLCTALKGGTAVQQLVFVCGTGVQRSEHGTATRRFDMRSHVRQVLLEAGLKSNEPSGKKESNPMYEGCVVVGKERVGDWAKSSIV